MRILLVKTSSLGDVVHNLPVVSDLRRSFPGARIDWCVEEAFADIPRLHPGVDKVIPVAIRRWRKNLGRIATWRELRDFRRRIAAEDYDVVLDTQGLLKSALIARQAHGQRCGYAAEAAREPFAARFYDASFVIPRNVHAVQRNRWLAAAAFDYPVDLPLDYGIAPPAGERSEWPAGPLAVLFTATSRDDKLWHEAHWCAVAGALRERRLTPVLPVGNSFERQRAERIAASVAGAVVPPSLSLRQVAALIGGAKLVIGVDTGLAHLAAALRVPTIALYIATEPSLTGVYGSGFVRNLGCTGAAPSSDEVLAVAGQALR
ncbi:MAG: lipopolysaccharide heptosyltransferase I [Candidatus Accumulibacter sp.]|uniref:lipopolysaccharide heptosyltransferase I n=1 Tax=Accumulibacter sp. TaxID=2053492 RepID=UPI001E0D1F52|nr:lipopolysaccharide heptosyltransferase I [Accumulibacter sp.]MCB1940598.1 lipopolysaccharide heptosyltransferase I [Accumulibacter sp.]MCP5248310.1 lipopolysaccharide heptosyltransferase I [Accumulibacter sp.]